MMSPADIFNLAVWGFLFLLVVIGFFRSIRLVPTKSAYLVERFGRYSKTLSAGFHALLPFMDKVSMILDLKEQAIEVPPQECFSKDEVKVEVDGVIYLSVTDPVRAGYGVTDYRFAAVQLAQTTTRSVIGTIDLDRTFEERDLISNRVVETLALAGASWGIRVHRYEIKNLQPPPTVRNAMEKQVNAERERRAIMARSEGERQSRINRSEGTKLELINVSEGAKQRLVNEAEGKAQEILTIADATANSIRKLAAVLTARGGSEALRLQLSERYFQQLKHLAKPETRIILPANLTDFEAWLEPLGLNADRDGK